MSDSAEFSEDEFTPKTEFARKLRASRTPAELAMWDIVHRAEFKQWRFTQQFPIRPYVIDVAARSIKVAIELDGESHNGRSEHDLARDEACREQGWCVVRFRNEDVLNRPEVTAKTLLNICLGRPRLRY